MTPNESYRPRTINEILNHEATTLVQPPIPDTTLTPHEILNILSPQDIEKRQEIEGLQNQIKNLENQRDYPDIPTERKNHIPSENIHVQHGDIQSVPHNPSSPNANTAVEPPIHRSQNNVVEGVSAVLPNAPMNEQNSWINNGEIKHVIPLSSGKETQSQTSQITSNLDSAVDQIKDNAKEQHSLLGNINN